MSRRLPTFFAAVEGHLDDILVAEHEDPNLSYPTQLLRRLRFDEKQRVLGRSHQHQDVGIAPGVEPAVDILSDLCTYKTKIVKLCARHFGLHGLSYLTSANERNPWSKAITLYRLLSFQSANSSSRRSVSGCIVYILWQFEIEPLPSPQLFLKIVSWLPVGQRDKVVQVPAKVDLAREHAS